MANSTAEQVLKTGMKAYLRLGAWVAGSDRSIGGMWSRLLEESRREMAESTSSTGPAPSTAPAGSSGAMSRTVAPSSEPRALSEKRSGGLEGVERAPLHVSSVQADRAAESAATAAGKASTPGGSPATNKPATPMSSGAVEKETPAAVNKAGASLSGAGDLPSPARAASTPTKAAPTKDEPKSGS